MSGDNPGGKNDFVEARAREVADQVRQADDERTRELIRVSTEHARAGRPPVHLSESQIKTLVDAVGQDLIEGADRPNLDERRLATVETQTQLLAQAVLVVTETVQTVAAAVDALHDEVHALDSRSDSDDVASPPAKAT
jgi:hypothetical protein